MKNILSLIILVGLLISPKAMALENQEYKKGNYSEVISKLEPNVEKLNAKQTLRLAHSYYKMKNYFKSKVLYYQVAKKRELSDMHKLALADILLSTNMLELSQKMLATCTDKKSKEFTRILNKVNWTVQNADYYSISNTEKFESSTMNANSNLLSFHNKTISHIQLDRRNIVSQNSLINYTNMPELNFTITAPAGYKNEKILIKNPFVITNDNTLFHSTLLKNDESKNSNKKGNQSLAIVKSTLENGKIVEGARLSFCELGSNYVSPFLFDNKMYFSSDKPGGFGGYDIYVVERAANNQWGTPINLGNKVNGSGNEMYPTIINGQLYFSSDSHEGFGGTDIYTSFNDGSTFGNPINLGKGINSGYDEYSLIKADDAKYYFITNRDNLKGYDEVFTTDKIENFTNTESLTSTH